MEKKVSYTKLALQQWGEIFHEKEFMGSFNCVFTSFFTTIVWNGKSNLCIKPPRNSNQKLFLPHCVGTYLFGLTNNLLLLHKIRYILQWYLCKIRPFMA